MTAALLFGCLLLGASPPPAARVLEARPFISLDDTLAGLVAELGNDAVVEEPTEEDLAFLEKSLSQYLPEKTGQSFRKVVSGRKLWNFDKDERAVWREAL